jgi:hypothetical protein
MSPFSGVDDLDFDPNLNGEELLARGTARQFVEAWNSISGEPSS